MLLMLMLLITMIAFIDATDVVFMRGEWHHNEDCNGQVHETGLSRNGPVLSQETVVWFNL
jgi:hypothetical protein